MNDEKIALDKNIQPLHLPSEISNVELIQAEQKTEEKREHQLPLKPSKPIDKLVQRVWYTRPISDEDDTPDETEIRKVTDDAVEEKIAAPDIDTSHSEDTKIIQQETSGPIPTWINDQVYGDKVSVLEFTE